jgi:hypothetical protein
MTGRIDTERILDAFLAPESDRLPDRVFDAALTEIARTPQRRALRAPWRFPDMPALSRATTLAALLVVAVIALGGAVYLIGPRPGTGGSTPPPVTTPGPTTTANLLDVSTWTPFTSARYGFSARYPSSFSAVPSFTSWRIPNFTGNMFDGFGSEGIVRWLYGASMALPAEMTQEAWLDAYRRDIVEDGSPLEPEACFEPRESWTPVTIDGRAAELRVGCQTLEAYLFVDDRVYLFGASAYDSAVPSTAELGVPDEFRALLETWLTTITLDPASAVESPSASPIPSPT